MNVIYNIFKVKVRYRVWYFLLSKKKKKKNFFYLFFFCFINSLLKRKYYIIFEIELDMVIFIICYSVFN